MASFAILETPSHLGLRPRREPRGLRAVLCTCLPKRSGHQCHKEVGRCPTRSRSPTTGRGAPSRSRSRTGAIRATALRQAKVAEDDFGLMSYDPAFLNTASVRSAITFIDGDARHPPLPRLPDRAAGRARARTSRPRTCSSSASCRPSDELARWSARDHAPHVPARERQAAHGGLPLRRAPDGDARSASSRRSRRSIPEASKVDDPEVADAAGRPADREGADDRGVVVPAQPRAAVRLPGQRPRLRRELPLDDVPDGRAALPRRAGARAGARGAVHPPRRPRAELLRERDALDRLEQGRSVLGARRRGGGALRAAARRRERGRAADARPRSAT